MGWDVKPERPRPPELSKTAAVFAGSECSGERAPACSFVAL